ncbi:MAG TPA: hypothetical protein VGO09_03260 [Flavisolibacter sp.]|nr:hypothetical protein [Flavisolibacter sp.]
MKKIGIIAAIGIGILFTISANAQSNTQYYKTAVGVRFSSNAPAINNSISFKYFFSQSTAVEALLSFGDPVALGALIEKHNDLNAGGLTWFYGAGAYIGFSGPRNVGAQGVLGLDYKIPSLPFNLSLYWKPELNIAKEFSFEPSAIGLSARFTFN